MSTRDGIPDMPQEERDMLAAEFVLGLLDPPEDARAADMVRTDATFAALVEHWRTRFGELDMTAALATPHPALLERIEDTVDRMPEAAPVRVTAQGSGEPASSRAPSQAVPGPFAALAARLWDNLGFWRAAGFAGVAASLLLALAIAVSPLVHAPQPQLVAVLLGPQGEPAAVVNTYADGTADLIPLRPIRVPDGRVLEVWTLQDRERGPVSIGLASEARRIRLDLKTLPRTGPDQLFEITLEPKGGSPIGRPTGPILMKGTTSVAL